MHVSYVREEISYIRGENQSGFFRYEKKIKKQECLKFGILCLTPLTILLPETFSNILESSFPEKSGFFSDSLMAI